MALAGGDGRAERSISVGPGERIQLDKGSLLKISTQKPKSGICRSDSDFHWHISTGKKTDDGYVYSYAQNQSPEGYRLSLKCVSEGDLCAFIDARSISVPLSNASPSLEVTFVVKPSLSSSSSMSVASPTQSYAWGHTIHSLFSSLFRFPST